MLGSNGRSSAARADLASREAPSVRRRYVRKREALVIGGNRSMRICLWTSTIRVMHKLWYDWEEYAGQIVWLWDLYEDLAIRIQMER